MKKTLKILASLVALFFATMFISACSKKANDKTDDKNVIDIVPQQEQLQKAKDLEKQLQIDAEERRKVIELQTNPQNGQDQKK